MIDTTGLGTVLGEYPTQQEARAEAERLLGDYLKISEAPWEYEGVKRISVVATVENMPMWVYAAATRQNGSWAPMFVFCIGRRSSIEYAQWMSRDDETLEPLPPNVTFRRIEAMADALPHRIYPGVR